jgi:hypothetical protein
MQVHNSSDIEHLGRGLFPDGNFLEDELECLRNDVLSFHSCNNGMTRNVLTWLCLFGTV